MQNQRNNLGQFEKGCLPWNKIQSDLEIIGDKILLFLGFALFIIVLAFFLRITTSGMYPMEFILFAIDTIIFSILFILLVLSQEKK